MITQIIKSFVEIPANIARNHKYPGIILFCEIIRAADLGFFAKINFSCPVTGFDNDSRRINVNTIARGVGSIFGHDHFIFKLSKVPA